MELMKSLGAFWLHLAKSAFPDYVTDQDLAVFERRYSGEGIPFLTDCLPRLGKMLDRSFQTGRAEPVLGFETERDRMTPLFLRRCWEVLFDKEGRFIGTEEAAGAVACIRQLSYCFYKLETSYTPEQEKEAITAFIAADESARTFDISRVLDEQLSVARSLVHGLLAGLNPFEIEPVHGSGASSCGVKPWERYDSFRYSKRLDRCFPYTDHFFYNYTDLADNLHVLLEAEEANPVSKVCFVPKDSRGPRVISTEPREHMYIQQGLMAKLYARVSSIRNIANMIDFRDQSRNQRLAREGSITGRLATLDCKEASDRLSNQLVKHLFPSNWVEALQACRSAGTILPDGSFRRFWKFAPMGSAVCFPVEAICFWAISMAACGFKSRDLSRLLNSKHRYRGVKVSVFGDDIIVPTQSAGDVINALERYGLKINRDKSYLAGPFRESCGGDYYFGHPVAPVRFRAFSDDGVAQYRMVQTVNTVIRTYGYWRVGVAMSEWVWDHIGPVPVLPWYDDQSRCTRKGAYIIGPYESMGPDRLGHRPNASYRRNRRFNRALHRLEFRLLCVDGQKISTHLSGWSRVLRRTMMRIHPDQSAADAALPKRLHAKFRWIG